MKQLLKKCLLLVVMFAAIASYSSGFNFHTNEQIKNVTSVTIDNVNKGSIFLIKDSYGVILYQEQIEETGTYSKRFDITDLPDAKYYFELYMQDEIKIIPFNVEANIAEFLKDAEYNIVKPEVTVKNDHVYISKLSLEEQSWEIDVYYEDGYDLAYNEKLKDTQSWHRVYDFSSSKKGNYYIVLSSGGRTFSNSISIIGKQ